MAQEALLRPAALLKEIDKLWAQFYDKRPPGDPKDTYRRIKLSLQALADEELAREADPAPDAAAPSV